MNVASNQTSNILIVDDTPENLTVLRDILTRAGYRVRPVLQGELALKIARMEPPDLVLLDVLMPGLNGYETCARLKSDPATADCPVLFISALDTTADKLRGFQAGGLDYITKPFREEEVLARVQTHLALRSARRELQAQNEALQAAAALREDVDRMLRHDLRGPLSNIIAFSELIIAATPASASSLAEHARVIVGAAYSTLSMIHGSFDLIKMERGTYLPQTEPFDLLELLQQIAWEMQLFAESKEVSVTFIPNTEGMERCLVAGERLLSRSLFYNVLKNAIEASPKGGKVEISLVSMLSPSQVEVRVRNAGAVPEVIRERFFDKYVTSGKADGTGLGTYSAKLMAQIQGGTIKVDTSEPGYTSLTVCLPAAMDFEALASLQDKRELCIEFPSVHLLIADDDSANRRYLKHLMPATWTVTQAENGTEALAMLCQPGIAVALLDIEMPAQSGIESVKHYLAWRIAQTPIPPRVALLALTGHHDEETRKECLAAGFERVLIKPTGKENLCDALRDVLLPVIPIVEIESDMAGLIPEFLNSRQQELARLAAAIEQGDAPSIVSIAHRLQGSFAMYGFAEAHHLASAIEQYGRDNRLQARRLFHELARYLERLQVCYV